jgi:hypothetical protein
MDMTRIHARILAGQMGILAKISLGQSRLPSSNKLLVKSSTRPLEFLLMILIVVVFILFKLRPARIGEETSPDEFLRMYKFRYSILLSPGRPVDGPYSGHRASTSKLRWIGSLRKKNISSILASVKTKARCSLFVIIVSRHFNLLLLPFYVDL